jgi:DNA-binding transcriptional ArsR family regulator
VVSGPNSAGDLLQLFRTGAVATRGELQQVTGLSRSTVTLRIDALLGAGYLTEDGAIPDIRRGRP